MNLIHSIIDSFDVFFSSFLLKSFFGICLGGIMYLLHVKHVQVFALFVLLVLIDLFTKWAAVAYQMLIEKGTDPEKIYLKDKYLGIALAFAEKRIGSQYMKKGFVNKLIIYGSATITAFLVDEVIHLSSNTEFVLNLTWLYLAGSEFLSILENMRDGGNTTMGKFLDTVKEQIQRRTGIKL